MGIFEFIYYIGYSLKKKYSLATQKKLPYKVISIGNITAGGTGKTPAVIALAEQALKRGFVPCVLTRGYKGKAKGPCFVSKGEGPLLNEKEAGDEAVLMANRLKKVFVVKGADRHKAGMFAINQLQADIPERSKEILFILDDGFQHWRLFRDRDILLIDSEKPFDNNRLLPVGLLREPVKEMKRADIIVITKAQDLDDFEKFRIENLVKEIRNHNSDARIFFSGHKPVRIIGPSGVTMPLKWAKGKGFFAFCGIGNPDSFKKTLKNIGCEIKGFKAYQDHYRYKQGDIGDILKEAGKHNAEGIITTEKDMTRLTGLDMPDNMFSLAVEFSVDGRFYDEAFKL